MRRTMNRVLTTHRGFVKIVPDAPAVIAAVMWEIASSGPVKAETSRGEKGQLVLSPSSPFPCDPTASILEREREEG